MLNAVQFGESTHAFRMSVAILRGLIPVPRRARGLYIEFSDLNLHTHVCVSLHDFETLARMSVLFPK